MSTPVWTLRFAFLLMTSALVGGCTSNTEERIALAKLASSCLINSDCESPMVCAFKSCHVECTTSRDCEDGARCIAAERPFRVCQLETERDCSTNADCPTPLVCGVDGECRDGCASARDCIEGQLCASGTCADAEELDEDGRLPTTTGEPGATEGSPCVYVSDCAGVLLCRGQICRIECKADLDCDTGEVCEDTRCVPRTGDLVACTYNSECATEEGELCRGGACRCSCADDRDCPSGSDCDGCGCVSAAPSCTYNSDCETPGQLCKNGSCSCECREDADCSAGESCDGCGCVPPGGISAGIVYGNVTIESAVDLPLYVGVREIRGSLSIHADTLTTYAAFSDLELVTGSISIAESAATSISLPSLVRVGGTLSVLGGVTTTSLSLPAFETGSLSITGPAFTQISLPLWTEGSTASFQFLPSLTALSLPSLTNVSDTLQFTYSENLGIVAVPSLEAVGSLSLLFDPTNAGLEEFRAPLLRTIAGTLNVNGTALTSLSYLDPTLSGTLEGAEIEGASFESNLSLSRCAVDALVANAGIASATATNNLACTSCAGATCAD